MLRVPRLMLLTMIGTSLLLGSLAAADEPADVKQTPANQKQREAAIRRALDRAHMLDFVESPLSDVVKKLREQTKVDILLDQRSLDDVGIGADTPVSFHLAGVSLRSALRLLLRDFELTWIIRDEALVITTPEVAEENQATLFYSIGDLVRIERPVDFLQMQFGGGGDGLGGGGLGGGGEAGGLRAGAIQHLTQLEEIPPSDGRLDYDTLVELITSTIAPDTWEELGGPGSVTRFRNLLAVSQVEEVHERIGAMLNTLRQFRKQAAAADGETPLVVDLPAHSDAVQKILAALNKNTTIRFEDTSLTDAIETISKKHGIPLLLDTLSLDGVGIGIDEGVSIDVRDIPLKSALQRMLRPLELTWSIEEGSVLMITTPDVAEENLATRMYHVRDLVHAAGVDRRLVEDELVELSQTIQSTIAPDSWDDVGGPGALAWLAEYDALIVSQTSEIHSEISELLAQLRSKIAAPQVAAAPAPAPDQRLHLVVYRLKTGDDGKPLVAVDELAEVVNDLIDPRSWHDRDVYLRGVGHTLVVKQSAVVHRKIVKLLEALDAIDPQQPGGFGGGGGGGGGFF